MIMVDIYVPALEREYDFKLDEKRMVSEIKEEVCRLIAQKEHCRLQGESREMILCEKKEGDIFLSDHTLEACGAKTGSRLMLL